MANEDLNSYEDLKEHFSSFLEIINEFNGIKSEKTSLIKRLEVVSANNETLRKSDNALTQQIQTLTKAYQNEDNISSLYFKLKEKYVDLEKKCSYLMEQNNSLQDKNLVEVTEMEERFETVRSNLIQDFGKKLNYSEQKFLREQNSSSKRENELRNELQLLQASSALQMDEMQATEKTLRSQLKDVIGSHNNLRQEYLMFKTQSQSESDAAKKMVNDLKCKLQFAEQQLHVCQEQLVKLTTEFEPPARFNKLAVKPQAGSSAHKYEALKLNSVSKCNKNENCPEKKISALPCISNINYSKSNLSTNTFANKVDFAACLPPLKQLSKINQKTKKRKLYKPGSVNFKDTDEFE